MRKFASFAGAVAVVVATPVYSQSIPERTGVNSVLGVAPKTEDFVKEVAVSDMFEIESSKLAQQKASAAPVKTFAGQMVTDHTKTSAELRSAGRDGRFAPEQAR